MGKKLLCNEANSETRKRKCGDLKRRLLPASASPSSSLSSGPHDISNPSAFTISRRTQSLLLDGNSQPMICPKEFQKIRRENLSLRKERDGAIASAKAIHRQQHDLYDSFKLLREKYDDLKAELGYIMWEYIPTQQVDDISSLAELGRTNHAVFETPNRISNYEIGRLLGEGQLSDVKLCTHTVTRKEYAIKIIKKQKISTMAGLKRVRVEVNFLRSLNHPNVVKFQDFINSPSCLYIITEVGGKDLFEFFEANPLGADTITSREVLLGIIQPLLYLHNRGISHRDLKPENILLSHTRIDGGTDINHRDIRICDFGESTIAHSTNGRELSDLCGSPGFFAPEMILNGDTGYNGFKADVWSVGCIMLELTRGHDEFCQLWMTTYNYDILHDEDRFEDLLQRAIAIIGKQPFENKESAEMHDFLKKILVLDPEARLSASQMLDHKWLHKKNDDDSFGPDLNVGDAAKSDDQAEIEYRESRRTSTSLDVMTSSKQGKRNIFRNSVSSRARKHFSGKSRNHLDENKDSSSVQCALEASTSSHPYLKLPPVEPEIPSFIIADRTIIEGKRIVETL